MLTIKAGNYTLATYEYAGNNGKLLKLIYGNGDVEEYVYDNLERLVVPLLRCFCRIVWKN